MAEKTTYFHYELENKGILAVYWDSRVYTGMSEEDCINRSMFVLKKLLTELALY